MTARISVRGFAVASATAVTTVGAVVGVASGSQQGAAEPVELAAADATLLADVPVDGNTQVQTASLTQQADRQTDAANAEAQKSAQEDARKQAAKDAEAKKEKADREAKEREEAKKAKEAREKAERQAKEREEASKAATRSTERPAASFPQQSSYSVSEVKAMAQQIVGGGQYQCFSNIVTRESGWNYTATNPSSGAYGLVQALPASKMSSAGADWRTNPATQIKWGLNYMNNRYGSPCGAWEFWQANHWY
ncbi:transglycosylase SLT domain-containing protein [Streptomyces sp. JJ66]|uniref:aggregation-promoting factor C-terminal-like domain-containing protein n=1 Tax=Streptomyces sp. JJ66 TaxID=2803843 RepID=UPI001C55D4F6|nr:transglycosylase SLT domain-containing protein [Streptomyces sp. JJ66]MBW1602808.1 transglycosylase SLT domain-containing protein [Streptomyces sp. JJ66]